MEHLFRVWRSGPLMLSQPLALGLLISVTSTGKVSNYSSSFVMDPRSVGWNCAMVCPDFSEKKCPWGGEIACNRRGYFSLTSCWVPQSPAKVKVRMWEGITALRLFPGKNSTLSHRLESKKKTKNSCRGREIKGSDTMELVWVVFVSTG